MPARILVLSASVGGGHLRAAQAMEAAFRQVVPDAEVQNVDVLQLTNAAFRQLYGKAYLDLVNKAPVMLGYFYDLMDKPPSPLLGTDRLRLALEKLNLKPLIDFLKSRPWDLVVSTHFLPAEIIASLRSRGTISAPQVTVTTDFETHRLWVNQPCERYFTATEEGARYLHCWGVPSGDTRVTGIPIHPVFSQAKDRAQLLGRHRLGGDRPVVLQLAGGFGVGPIEKLYNSLLTLETPVEVVVVTGRNQALREKLEAITPPARHRTHVLGFTDDMDELMAVADIVVTKPGGLTISEALARGVAIAIVNPIPGQESRNSDYLLENGAAIKINNVGTMAFKLDSLLDSPGRLKALRENAGRLGRPAAAFDIARESLELVG